MNGLHGATEPLENINKEVRWGLWAVRQCAATLSTEPWTAGAKRASLTFLRVTDGVA